MKNIRKQSGIGLLYVFGIMIIFSILALAINALIQQYHAHLKNREILNRRSEIHAFLTSTLTQSIAALSYTISKCGTSADIVNFPQNPIFCLCFKEKTCLASLPETTDSPDGFPFLLYKSEPQSAASAIAGGMVSYCSLSGSCSTETTKSQYLSPKTCTEAFGAAADACLGTSSSLNGIPKWYSEHRGNSTAGAIQFINTTSGTVEQNTKDLFAGLQSGTFSPGTTSSQSMILLPQNMPRYNIKGERCTLAQYNNDPAKLIEKCPFSVDLRFKVDCPAPPGSTTPAKHCSFTSSATFQDRIQICYTIHYDEPEGGTSISSLKNVNTDGTCTTLAQIIQWAQGNHTNYGNAGGSSSSSGGESSNSGGGGGGGGSTNSGGGGGGGGSNSDGGGGGGNNSSSSSVSSDTSVSSVSRDSSWSSANSTASSVCSSVPPSISNLGFRRYDGMDPYDTVTLGWNIPCIYNNNISNIDLITSLSFCNWSGGYWNCDFTSEKDIGESQTQNLCNSTSTCANLRSTTMRLPPPWEPCKSYNYSISAVVGGTTVVASYTESLTTTKPPGISLHDSAGSPVVTVGWGAPPLPTYGPVYQGIGRDTTPQRFCLRRWDTINGFRDVNNNCQTTSTKLDDPVTKGGTYIYKVQQICSQHNPLNLQDKAAAESPEVTVQIPNPFWPPVTAPTKLRLTKSPVTWIPNGEQPPKYSIAFTWDYTPAENSTVAEGFAFERSKVFIPGEGGAPEGWSSAGSVNYSPPNLFTDTGLSAGTTYSWRMKTYKCTGSAPQDCQPVESTYHSMYGSLKTPVYFSTTFDPPTEVVAQMITDNSKDQKGVQITWKDNSSSDAWFEITRSFNNISFSIPEKGVFANRTTYIDTDYYSGLKDGVTYYYKVTAVKMEQNIRRTASSTVVFICYNQSEANCP